VSTSTSAERFGATGILEGAFDAGGRAGIGGQEIIFGAGGRDDALDTGGGPPGTGGGPSGAGGRLSGTGGRPSFGANGQEYGGWEEALSTGGRVNILGNGGGPQIRSCPSMGRVG